MRGEGGEKQIAEDPPQKLTIKALLHFLYEEAALNRWSPKMEGKRNWYVIRKYLLSAADNKVTKKLPLAKSIFIRDIQPGKEGRNCRPKKTILCILAGIGTQNTDGYPYW